MANPNITVVRPTQQRILPSVGQALQIVERRRQFDEQLGLRRKKQAADEAKEARLRNEKFLDNNPFAKDPLYDNLLKDEVVRVRDAVSGGNVSIQDGQIALQDVATKANHINNLLDTKKRLKALAKTEGSIYNAGALNSKIDEVLHDTDGNLIDPNDVSVEMLTNSINSPEVIDLQKATDNWVDDQYEASSISDIDSLGKISPTQEKFKKDTFKSKFFKLNSDNSVFLDDNGRPVVELTNEQVRNMNQTEGIKQHIKRIQEENPGFTTRQAAEVVLERTGYSKPSVSSEEIVRSIPKDSQFDINFIGGSREREVNALDWIRDYDALIRGGDEAVVKASLPSNVIPGSLVISPKNADGDFTVEFETTGNLVPELKEITTSGGIQIFDETGKRVREPRKVKIDFKGNDELDGILELNKFRARNEPDSRRRVGPTEITQAFEKFYGGRTRNDRERKDANQQTIDALNRIFQENN